MYKYIDNILKVGDENEYCFFDPDNLLIFSNPNTTNKDQEIVNDYNSFLKRHRSKEKPQLFNLKNSIAICLELHVTNQCNLRCKYCYLGQNGPLKMNNMSKKTIEKAFDFVSKNCPNIKSIKISLFGGEPTLYWKNFDFLLKKTKEKFKDKKIHFTFATNGTFLNSEVISFISQKEVSFCLSLDGDPKTQNFLRPTYNNSGSFELIEKNLPCFQQIRPSLMVRATITPLNYKIRNLFEYFKNKGFKTIGFALCSSENFQLTNDFLQAYLEELEKFCDLYFNHLITDDQLIDVIPFTTFLRILHNGNKKQTYCNNGKTLFAISTDEKIYLCHRFVGDSKFQIGSLNEGFDNQNLIRKKILNFDITKQKKCQNCFAKHLCIGGCPHEQYILPSKIVCSITKKIILLSIKLYYKLSVSQKFSKKMEAFMKYKS